MEIRIEFHVREIRLEFNVSDIKKVLTNTRRCGIYISRFCHEICHGNIKP